MFVPLNRRLAFIIWMTLSLFAFWVHELRAETTRAHLDAHAASVKLREAFSRPVVVYPSTLLGRAVPLVRGAYRGLTAEGARVRVAVVDRRIADLDRDGITEVALLIQERRCLKKVCTLVRRLDVWTVRAAGITRSVSHALSSRADERFFSLQIERQRLTILGKRVAPKDETLRDITETFRYTGAALEVLQRTMSDPYTQEGSGC